MQRNTPELPILEEEWFGQIEPFWSRACRTIKEYLYPSRPKAKISDEELLQQAHLEILEAQNRFSSVEEPELVDCAIYALKSAEMKYDYIIKRIKQKRTINVR